MTNLLPEQYKKQIQREYSFRRIVVSLLLISLVSLIAGVGLFPSYMIVRNRLDTAAARLARLESSAEENNVNQYLMRLQRTNQLVSVLEPPSSELRAYVVINGILERLNNSISLTGLTFETERISGASDAPDDAAKRLRVSLSGIAANREALTELEQAVKGIAYIDSVNLPVSNFAERRNIEFSVKLLGSF